MKLIFKFLLTAFCLNGLVAQAHGQRIILSQSHESGIYKKGVTEKSR
ncbi:MAG: hypothetical protein WCJ95_18350 [Mariniphaga sp.]